MSIRRHSVVAVAMLALLALSVVSSPRVTARQITASGNGQTAAAPPKSNAQTQSSKPATTAPAAMTNQEVIRLAKAKLSDDVIISRIKKSKTKFDVSTNGLVALKQAGVSDAVISAMVDAADAASASASKSSSSNSASSGNSASPSPARKQTSSTAATRPSGPASNKTQNVAPNETAVASAHNAPPPPPAHVSSAPPNYGVYVYDTGELKPLGRIETKVQVSKFRTLMKSVVPFVRQKIDINVPGAHSSSRFEATRPTFFAYFPPSRDVSKFKLLQCKITGQNFDQRTVANASIMFSTEQNQDEVLLDIGPTEIKDLYRLYPREDLPAGEFAFVEGNTGNKSASNIDILDVYDFGVDRKEEKLGLKDFLDTLPAAGGGDQAFLSWPKEECQRIVDSKEAKTGITGSMEGRFKRQFTSLAVYWDDPQFAAAFARLEMIEKELSDQEAMKLVGLLLNEQQPGQYYVLVSIGAKVGSGHLIGANEGERLMRPFDASLSSNKTKDKDVVPAKHLQFIGGYAGIWRVDFDQNSIKGPLMEGGAQELVFEARLNQNLDFKATFPMDKVNGTAATAAPPQK
jgi:hypothetical protein